MNRDMEDNWKHKLEDARITPPDEVLSRIQRTLDGEQPASQWNSKWVWTGIISAVAIVSAVVYFSLSPDDFSGAQTTVQLPSQISAVQPSTSQPAAFNQTKIAEQQNLTPVNQETLQLNPAAGQDQEVCGRKAKLNARHSSTLSLGKWVADSKAVSFISESAENPEQDPNASIVVSDYGVYKLKWMETYRSTSAFDEVTIRFKEVPKVNLTDNQQVCGYEIEINSGGEAGLWSSPDNLKIINPTASVTRVKSVKAGSYELIWTENNDGCRASDTLTLKFTNQPIAEINLATQGACYGSPVRISGTYNSAYSYSWDFDGGISEKTKDQNYLVNWKEGGDRTVSLTVSNPEGCEAQARLEFKIPLAPAVDFNFNLEEPAAPSMAYFTNRTSPANPSDEDKLSYLWEFGDGSRSSDTHPDHLYKSPGTYAVKLTATDLSGCKSSSDTKTVIVRRTESHDKAIYFTPNGDNINDEFILENQGLDAFICLILNQKGEKIAELNQENPRWNGQLKTGNPAPEGSYYYILRGTDSNGVKVEYPGIIYLLKE